MDGPAGDSESKNELPAHHLSPAGGTQRLAWLEKVRIATRAMTHRNYRLFITGQFLSLIGTWIQAVAQSWLVYRLSGSAVMLGLVGFASQAPYLFAPIGGVLADRVDRRRLLIVTQSLLASQAVLLSWLTLSGHIRVWHLFLTELALGIIGMFDMTARQAFLVEMVGKEDLMNGIALNSSVYNTGRILGPAVAGVLVATIGEGWCFLVNVASFLAVIIGLRMMRLAPREPEAGFSPVDQFREGWEYVRSTPPLRALLINLGIVSMMNYPFIVLMPVFADRVLHGGPKAFGLLMSAFGSGALLGGIYMASRTGLRGLSKTMVRAALIYSIALLVFAFSQSFLVSCAALMIVGACIVLQVASTNTSLQTIAPDGLRGRVMGFYGMMFLGMAPFGSLIAGWFGDWIGVRYTVALTAVVCIINAAIFNRSRVVVRAALRRVMEQPVPGAVSEGPEVSARAQVGAS